MSGFLTSVVRTVVPFLWGLLVAWLLSRGWITPEVAETMQGWLVPMVTGLVVVVGALWYTAARWLEPRLVGLLGKVLPAGLADTAAVWVRRLLLGAASAPVYGLASGGSASTAGRYMVGERGTETVVPDRAGLVGRHHVADQVPRALVPRSLDEAVLWNRIGRAAYDAYASTRGGVSVGGDSLPEWDGQRTGIQDGWIAAALAARAVV